MKQFNPITKQLEEIEGEQRVMFFKSMKDDSQLVLREVRCGKDFAIGKDDKGVLHKVQRATHSMKTEEVHDWEVRNRYNPLAM